VEAIVRNGCAFRALRGFSLRVAKTRGATRAGTRSAGPWRL